ENWRVQQGLLDRLTTTDVSLLGSRHVEHLVREADGWAPQLAYGERLQAPPIVAADGARSRLRERAGFAMRDWDYLHHAVVTTVQTERPHAETAWQSFLDAGPLAFLPLQDRDGRHYCSIVWSLVPEEARR